MSSTAPVFVDPKMPTIHMGRMPCVILLDGGFECVEAHAKFRIGGQSAQCVASQPTASTALSTDTWRSSEV